MKTRLEAIKYLLLFLLLLSGACKKTKLAPEYKVVRPENGYISISLDSLKDRVNQFTYKYKGQNINFMVIRFSPDRVGTFLDADYLCYKEKLGFKVEGNKLICVHHGFSFDLDHPESWRGNHVPIPLNSTTEDGYIKIKEDILKKAYRFFR